ncbi:MAG: hypothetical protein V2A79_10635 [Planctomycetota bacterium]
MRTQGLLLAGLAACVFMLCAPTEAKACHHEIDSVTLSPACACPGDEVQVTVRVRLYSMWWKSTRVDGTCFNHDYHYGTDGALYSETFAVTAPQVPGVYDLEVKTYSLSACSSYQRTATARLTVVCCCADGADGLHCWDLNANGACDLDTEDVNRDQICDALDCQGPPGEDGADGEDGTSCTVEEIPEGAVIRCTDGTSVTIYHGQDGEDGEDGEDGTSCTAIPEGDCVQIECEDGTTAQVCDGQDGQDGMSCTVLPEGESCARILCEDGTSQLVCSGQDGQDGVDGTDGTSCTVQQTHDGARIVCEDGSVARIRHGQDGINCWDLNENGRKDFCHPMLQSGPGECDEQLWECYCGEGKLSDICGTQAKARLAYKLVDEPETLGELVFMSEREIDEYVCTFTEDTDSNGVIDVLDCRGQDGEPGQDGASGASGGSGADGADGADGRDGSSCTVADNGDGTYTLSCEDGTSVTIHDGQDGRDGVDGQDGKNGADGEDGVCVSCEEEAPAPVPPIEEELPAGRPAGRGAGCGVFNGVALILLPLAMFLWAGIRRRS